MAMGYSASSSSGLSPRSATRAGWRPTRSARWPRARPRCSPAPAPRSGVNRWGDYSDMTVDPTDDCTFWYTNEYNGSGGWNWSTRIGSFKFPAAAAAPPPTPTNTPSPADQHADHDTPPPRRPTRRPPADQHADPTPARRRIRPPADQHAHSRRLQRGADQRRLRERAAALGADLHRRL